MTEHLKIYLCHECGRDFLFESDKDDHMSDTGHRLFVIMELEELNDHSFGYTKNLEDATLDQFDVAREFLQQRMLPKEERSSINSPRLSGFTLNTDNRILQNRVRQQKSQPCDTIAKPYHGRIDWDVAKRFLLILHDNGPIKKTTLAMKTGVNNGTCTKYIEWMLEIRWISISQDKIALAKAGFEVHACMYSAKLNSKTTNSFS